jgi:hypothetical protein
MFQGSSKADTEANQLYGTMMDQCPNKALKDFADLVLSLPAAEAENERIFSIRKYVVGERGGRSKSDLVTARVRTRMEQTLHTCDI